MANHAAKGRKGENHWRAKVNSEDVRLIRELLADRDYHRGEAAKLTFEAIAAKFDLHESHVRKIYTRSVWPHV